MNFKNLQLSLFQNSKCFWEERIVFDDQTQTPESPSSESQEEAQKAKESWKNETEKETKEAKQAVEATDKKIEGSTNRIAKAWEAVGTETLNSSEIAQTVWEKFQKITLEINNQKLIINLTETLKQEAPATQPETTPPATKTPEASQETVLTKATLNSILHSFDLSITIEGVGDIEIPEDTEEALLNAVIEGKQDVIMSDSDYLKQQFEKSDSAESKILLKGYQEIAQRLEVKQEEKGLIQELVWTLDEPYKKLATNENLQNIISRRFDISKDIDKFILIDQADPEKKIEDPKKFIQDALKKEYPDLASIVKWLTEKDQTQSKSIENIKTQIAEMQEETAESGNSFFDQIRDLVVLFQEFFSSGFNMDKVEGMWKRLKLKNDTSETNEFSMTYKDGETVNKQNVYAIMRGKTLTVNQGEETEKSILITEPEKQLQDIQIGDGVVAFKAVALEGEEEAKAGKKETEKTSKEKVAEENVNKLSLNTIWDETWKILLGKLNNKETLTIGSINGKNPLKIQNTGLTIETFKTVANGIVLKTKESNKTYLIKPVINQKWELEINNIGDNNENIVVKVNQATKTIELSKKVEQAKDKKVTLHTLVEKYSELLSSKLNNRETLTIGSINGEAPLKIKSINWNIRKLVTDENTIYLQEDSRMYEIKPSFNKKGELTIDNKEDQKINIFFNKDTNTIEISKKNTDK